MQEEIWERLAGYDKYFISNLGNIVREEKNGMRFQLSYHLDKDGYFSVGVAINGVFKTTRLHRLVAETFVLKMDGCDIAFHVDRDKSNNAASNISWGNKFDIGRRRSETLIKTPPVRKGVKGAANKLSKKVVKLDFDGNFICEYESLSDAGRDNGTSSIKISEVCMGKRTTSGGFRWMFLEEYKSNGYVPKWYSPRDNVLDVISRWRKRIDFYDTNDEIKYTEIIIRAARRYLGVHEEWVCVSGFEDCYEVSSFGRVRSLDRDVGTPMGFTIFKKGKILRPTICDGYFNIKLSKDGYCKTEKVHRIVAKSFLVGSDFSLEVNHLDFNRHNNYLGNLEFCTKSKNLEHMRYMARKDGREWRTYKEGNSVVQLTLDNEFVKEYRSINCASRETETNRSSIEHCCSKKKRNSAGGYKWVYTDEYYDSINK